MSHFEQSAPLSGIKIIDLTRHMAGPYATVSLADYGADVIKIETLPGGDASRDTGELIDGKVSAPYLMWNRGKRSIAVDMRKEGGRDIVRRLAERADVLIENYRPGVTRKMGIGYEEMAKLNARLIYVSISAFGDGSLAAFPGTDPVVQAMSGVMSVTGERDGPPLLVGVPIADFAAAMAAFQAVLLGLLARSRTGKGQLVEISMLHVMMTALTTRLATYWATGRDPTRNGGAHTVVMPYQVWQSADGFVVAGVWSGANTMWPLFCEALEMPELAASPRYQTNSQRLDNREELEKIIQAKFLTKPTLHWEERFRSRSVLFSPVYTFRDLFEHPAVKEAGIVSGVAHPQIGFSPQLTPPIRLSDTPGGLGRHPPMLGEHSREILREAGFDSEEIQHFLASEIVAEPRQEK
jgi:crotonobetainyl-CoA:carnitine CoA-transferase CaiB-like acyl-CoA transferase